MEKINRNAKIKIQSYICMQAITLSENLQGNILNQGCKALCIVICEQMHPYKLVTLYAFTGPQDDRHSRQFFSLS